VSGRLRVESGDILDPQRAIRSRGQARRRGPGSAKREDRSGGKPPKRDDRALEAGERELTPTLEQVAASLSYEHHWCIGAESEDLRAKVVQAIERGTPKTQATKTFDVSRLSVKRYAQAAREGKPLTPKKHLGSKPKLDEPGCFWRPTWRKIRCLP
jgi:hypothetical protein